MNSLLLVSTLIGNFSRWFDSSSVLAQRAGRGAWGVAQVIKRMQKGFQLGGRRGHAYQGYAMALMIKVQKSVGDCQHFGHMSYMQLHDNVAMSRCNNNIEARRCSALVQYIKINPADDNILY